MMVSEEHVCALLGMIIILLTLMITFFVYKEIKISKSIRGCTSPIARNASFMGGMPSANSSRMEAGGGDRDAWDRTLSALEDLVTTHCRQIKKPLLVKNDPKLDIFNGKGMIRGWIRKAERILAQMPGEDEDKVRYVLNHIDGAAADRLYNCGIEWRNVSEIFGELMKVYGKKTSVWEMYERMAARKQRNDETVWAFLDAILEICDEFQHQGNRIDEKLIGECMARNLEKPVLGMKLKNRIDERPEDSLEQWVEWIATKEQEWKCFTRSREIRERDEENKDERMRCYNCGEKGHVSRWCSNEGYHLKRSRSNERNWRSSGTESQANNNYKSRAGNSEGPAEM